jgi:NADH:ubiquinone oxidoreductase subunit F (NADH-binding)
MTTLTAPPLTTRLLAHWRSAHSSSLDAHLAMHGPLPLPVPGDAAWPDDHARQINASGLRGRGGAGFSAWRKLDSVRATRDVPVVIVNAMEGEPASAKDRVLLECAPHLVLDGAQVTAKAIRADRIIVCVADTEPRAADSVLRAVGERRAVGLDPVAVEVARPPGGFVSGEESALISWLDRRTCAPTFRVDKTVPLRVAKRPSLVHNTETLAHVALISRHGSRWFREVGTEDAPGTTLVTVSGAVGRGGVYEVALGTSLSEIVGLSETTRQSDPLAVITGGYGGTFVGPEHLGVGFSPEELCAVGATAGAGVICVIPTGSCGVAETARVARYMAGESSRQCGPCEFGLPAVADSLERLWRAEAGPDQFELLNRRIDQVDGRGACRHPDGLARLVRSAFRVFADDFTAHASGRTCAGARRPSVLTFPRSGLPEAVS